MSLRVEPTPLEATCSEPPYVPLRRLDTVWFQVAGTICNFNCRHCFISCSPENDSFHFLTLKACARYLEEACELGVEEFYFTGGEPFANPELCDILELALRKGPATVLTNATLLREDRLDQQAGLPDRSHSTLDRLEDQSHSTLGRLEKMRREAAHPLEIRVSLDGFCAESNDPIRGKGTFARTIEGTQKLLRGGFEPIITITRTWEGCDEGVLAEFRRLLVGIGYSAPRLKILPALKLGAEVTRSGGYGPKARVTREMMEDYDLSRLLCSSARLVTDKGVWVCPILLDFPEAQMGSSLAKSIRDYPLRHAACHTCWQHGAICSNVTCPEPTGGDTCPTPPRA